MPKRLIPMIALLLMLAASCTKTVYVPVERVSVRTDTLLQKVIRRDSVHVTDSVVIWSRGDSVIKEKYRNIYVEVARRDTLVRVVESHDTLPVIVEVEKPLSRWQRLKLDFGEAVMALALLLVVVFFVAARKR